MHHINLLSGQVSNPNILEPHPALAAGMQLQGNYPFGCSRRGVREVDHLRAIEVNDMVVALDYRSLVHERYFT
jgi:hypothetical protein